MDSPCGQLATSLPVGCVRRTRKPNATASSTMPRMRVVFPEPGPPVRKAEKSPGSDTSVSALSSKARRQTLKSACWTSVHCKRQAARGKL
eukprot:8012767-Pyramimonas_sp.AAC.1